MGYRHVEIGLPQVFTNVTLFRLRQGLGQVLRNALENALAACVEPGEIQVKACETLLTEGTRYA